MSKDQLFENANFIYKLEYFDWIGYLSISFDKCSLGDTK